MFVQKFGGMAMKDQETRLKCIQHIKEGLKDSDNIVVVVSAMGRIGDPYSTDTLLNLTNSFRSSSLASDLIASCGELIAAAVFSAELERSGIMNKVLHGFQAGILTTGEFGNGSILHIDKSTILKSLEKNRCVIVPGFQGIDEDGHVITLGRGGSDFTAIALASALHGTHVEFFKDVPGVMTNDPHKFTNSTKIDDLTLTEFMHLLECEHPIIQKRAALYAIKKAIPLYIRGITGTETGTWVRP